MKSYWKLGCRWGSKSEGKPLFFDLLLREKIVISWVDKDFGNGNNVLLTDGFTPIGIAITKSDRKTIIEKEVLKEEFLSKQIDFSRDLYYYEADIYPLLDADFTFDYQKGISRIWSNKIHSDINRNLNDLLNSGKMNNIIGLLKYKKQIILQGPPGTGKTRLAKMIAQDILSGEIPSFTISKEIIAKYMIPGLKFPSAKDRIEYEVEKVGSSGVSIIALSKNIYVPLFSEIITAYNNKVWQKEGAITKGNDSYSAAIAKYISNEQLTASESIENSDQFKLIQFHPSYTYEDFVRGIVAKPNPDGEGILYESENKTLGIFAEEALQNYQLSKKKINISISDIELFNLFISNIKERIAESDEQRLQLTEAVYLFEPDDKRFKYKGDNWKAHSKGLNMKFSELQKIIIANVTERADVKQLTDVEELTKQHASYFIRVVEMFYAFMQNHSLTELNKETKASLKNYILVIDEINRANLSSVLGELIYALEYRGETVEGMYAIDNNNKLTLPPNLYIIGTMNTADRSVGHIDYAVRRRFAFVDVLPKDLTDEPNIKFDKILFNAVAKLFIEDYEPEIDYSKVLQIKRSKHLSEEFNVKDVWLGHSYFIDKNTEGGNMQTRLDYEIKPILFEYVKDGVLKESAINEIEHLKTTI